MAKRFTAALLALAAFLTPAPTARGAETATPVSYLEPYNMDWLAYIDPADVPPNPYAVCVVDTGVAITPDTPPDNPAGPIVKRYAFDGGTGEPQTTNAFGLHGTRMAMAAAAPINDWGTVGVWPGARIISMRATKEQEQFIRLLSYDHLAYECAKEQSRTPTAAVLLSLSCRYCEPTASQAASLDETIAFAHSRGVSVVSAAGNNAGDLHYPADQPGVFAVGAGATDGSLCVDSAYSDTVAVVAPGCPVDTADPLTGIPQTFSDGGTSTATALAATMMAVLRTLRPDSTFDEVESWLRDSARLVGGKRLLDGEAAARAAGLGAVVDRATARMAPASPADQAAPASMVPADYAAADDGDTFVPIRLPSPNRKGTSAVLTRGLVRVRVLDRPPGALLEVHAGHRRRSAPEDTLSVRIERSVRWIDLRYLPSSSGVDQPSYVLRLRRRSAGRFR